MTVFSYGNNQKDPLFRQASQVFRIAAHPLRPHANREYPKHITLNEGLHAFCKMARKVIKCIEKPIIIIRCVIL